MSDYIALIWRAYRAGALTAADMLALQAGAMPRCPDCGGPAVVLHRGRPVCAACYAREVGAALPSGERERHRR